MRRSTARIGTPTATLGHGDVRVRGAGRTVWHARADPGREQRLRALGALATGIAHDLNNELMCTSMHLELLLRTLQGSARNQTPPHAEAVQRGLAIMAQTVSAIRQFTHGSSEGTASVTEALELASALACPTLRMRAVLAIETKTAPVVRANPAELAQVLLNLILLSAESFRGGEEKNNRIIVRYWREDGFICTRIACTRPEQGYRVTGSRASQDEGTDPTAWVVSSQIVHRCGGTLARIRGAAVGFVLRLVEADE